MRNIISLLAIVAVGLSLAACATPPPISANPVQTVTNAILPPGGTVVTGLQNAAYNLDQAVAIQILPASDPADACVHGALQAIGQDVGMTPPPAAPSFTPKVSDLLSAGSVAYILAAQAKSIAANPGVLVPPSCEQLVGHFVLSGVNAPAQAVINAAVHVLP